MVQLVWRFLLLIVLGVVYSFACDELYNNRRFPEYFQFGVASSAYQIEGAWNVSGKRDSIWDHTLHTNPDFSKDHSNADISCDFYHKYEEDIINLKFLGVDYFRMSISWPRILPYGTDDFINWNGIRYYKRVFTALLKHGIQPMVTLSHWDLPQALQDRGGYSNPVFVQWFGDYARLAFEEFGDLVKFWATFNEPLVTCQWGYGLGQMAPGIKGDGIVNYNCAHNLIKAHANAYHIYDKEFRYKQGGKVGIVLMSPLVLPASNRQEDIDAAEKANQFTMGWFANPIYVGDYPQVMKERVAYRSLLEGRKKSRLPEFTREEINLIRGTYDYFGLNHYTSLLGAAQAESPIDQLGFFVDIGVNLTDSPDWQSTCVPILKNVPFTMRKMLLYIKEHYGNPQIHITENGFCNYGGLEDDDRISSFKSYLSSARDAMQFDNVDVRSYTLWSYSDSFEWDGGFIPKFGLFNVDFSDPKLPRVPKKSAFAYKNIIETHCLADTCVN